MNRKQRRQHGDRDKVRTYTLTDVQIQKMKENVLKDCMIEAFHMMLCIPCLALKDKFGFGAERLNRFLDAASFWLEEVNRDGLSILEVEKTLEDEIGYDIYKRVKEITSVKEHSAN